MTATLAQLLTEIIEGSGDVAADAVEAMSAHDRGSLAIQALAWLAEYLPVVYGGDTIAFLDLARLEALSSLTPTQED